MIEQNYLYHASAKGIEWIEQQNYSPKRQWKFRLTDEHSLGEDHIGMHLHSSIFFLMHKNYFIKKAGKERYQTVIWINILMNSCLRNKKLWCISPTFRCCCGCFISYFDVELYTKHHVSEIAFQQRGREGVINLLNENNQI